MVIPCVEGEGRKRKGSFREIVEQSLVNLGRQMS